MVRFKPGKTTIYVRVTIEFQFLNGAIQTFSAKIGSVYYNLFQFLSGSIQTANGPLAITTAYMFQFLYAAIQTLEFTIKSIDKGTVSIPIWCDLNNIGPTKDP